MKMTNYSDEILNLIDKHLKNYKLDLFMNKRIIKINNKNIDKQMLIHLLCGLIEHYLNEVELNDEALKYFKLSLKDVNAILKMKFNNLK